MLDLEKIGTKIALIRKQSSMTQNELASELFVTHQAVSKWENGKSIPSIEILHSLTTLFNVSIDDILDDTDILADDYESLLRNYPRQSVIANFIKKDNLDSKIDNIFYLLTTLERKVILELIVSKRIKISIKNIWHNLSKDERSYILVIILSNKFDFDLNEIFYQLTTSEQYLAHSQFKNSTYKYKLPNIIGMNLWRNG